MAEKKKETKVTKAKESEVVESAENTEEAAKAKESEVVESAENTEEAAKAKESEVNKSTEKKKKAKETVSVDLGSGPDVTVETMARVTPFGVEVWDSEAKRTVMKPHG